jgi:hypothetical protein
MKILFKLLNYLFKILLLFYKIFERYYLQNTTLFIVDYKQRNIKCSSWLVSRIDSNHRLRCLEQLQNKRIKDNYLR